MTQHSCIDASETWCGLRPGKEEWVDVPMSKVECAECKAEMEKSLQWHKDQRDDQKRRDDERRAATAKLVKLLQENPAAEIVDGWGRMNRVEFIEKCDVRYNGYDESVPTIHLFFDRGPDEFDRPMEVWEEQIKEYK